jgi:hypothetical protein
MATAPLPAKLPGNYCVIAAEDLGQGTKKYTLILDDPDQSSFDLGENIQRIMQALRFYRMDDLLFNALDAAREFGTAQAIFADSRIIRL